MDGSADRTDEEPAPEDPTAWNGAPEDAALFDAVVVRYESGSDRCTLVPRDATTEERLNAWLTADLESVVDLDDAR